MTRYQLETCMQLDAHCKYMKKSKYDPYGDVPMVERPIPGVILYDNEINGKTMEVLPDGSITLYQPTIGDPFLLHLDVGKNAYI